MSTPEVREVMGCVATAYTPNEKKAIITEGEKLISIAFGSYTEMSFTVSEARRLARCLNRLAQRVEARR